MEIRRCILFAGYNSQKNIDDVDLYHLEKLVQIGDVFCCYDNANFPKDQFEKLKKLGVKKAIAVRHGEYDFGSWKRLFRTVGWDKIAEYDEVITVNNSIILTGDLLSFLTEFEQSDAEFFAPALLNEHYPGPVVSVTDYLEQQSAFHNNTMFASILWAMKSSLVRQLFVRNFFENVRAESTRLDVCYKYEREFSRKILRRKIKTMLAIKVVYPTSFLYTEIAFGLVVAGFPYLKRKALLGEFYPLRVLDARIDWVCRNISAQAAKILRHAYDLVKLSDVSVDAAWYLKQYPDVAHAKLDPEYHYEKYGRAEGRTPNPKHIWLQNRQKSLDASSKADIFELDEDWYVSVNPDIEQSGMKGADHFKKHGERELRDPNSKFSSKRYLFNHPGLAGEDFLPFKHFVANRNKKYEAEQKSIASKYENSKKLLIFFNVARDVIGGGMLSIDRFAANAKAISSETGYDVAVSGVPLGKPAVQFTKFEPSMDQVEFRVLAEMADPDDVVIFLPEVFALGFAKSLTSFELAWLIQRKSLKIVIMNQNHEMMPLPAELQESFFPISLDVTISTAHSRYCTQSLASRYMMPVTQLTPFLPTMKKSKFADKERIILLSADTIAADPSGMSRDYVVKLLKARLPDYEFITIENMALEDYLDLASRAMFSVTFGEGMDGYYIEPVLAGAISFAVYNSTFFPTNFADVPGIFPDWSSLVSQMPDLVNHLTHSGDYDSTSEDIRAVLAESYSTEKSQAELGRFIKGEVDHLPAPQSEHLKNSMTVKNDLLSLGFKFFEFAEHRVCSLLDGTTLRYLGGDFYNLIDEVCVRHDYDVRLDPDQEYVLIDLGANVGLASIYLLNKYPNIVKSYAFEPVEFIGGVAQENIAGNRLSDRIELYQIGLSSSFSQKNLQFSANQSAAFSTDSETLPKTLENFGEVVSPPKFVDVEVASASAELANILDRHAGKRFILKCDTRGSEFAVIASLDSADMLKHFEMLVIKIHFRSPDPLIESLGRNGFSVETRCVSEVNNIHTIWASRDQGRFPSRTAAGI